MKLHERYFIVRDAEIAFKSFYLDWACEHDLTYPEATQILASQIINDMKDAIRVERHGDIDKRGDEA